MRFILASSSSARLELLQRAGIAPEMIPAHLDESTLEAPEAASLTLRLAQAKGEKVASQITGNAALVACDSLLEFEGKPTGKPHSPSAAKELWDRLRGRQGTLHTGHFVWHQTGSETRSQVRLSSSEVFFADLSDDEIEHYVATGEPQRAAGGFALAGLGGPYITQIIGDPHTVSGLSLALLRQCLLDLGLAWQQLPRCN